MVGCGRLMFAPQYMGLMREYRIKSKMTHSVAPSWLWLLAKSLARVKAKPFGSFAYRALYLGIWIFFCRVTAGFQVRFRVSKSRRVKKWKLPILLKPGCENWYCITADVFLLVAWSLRPNLRGKGMQHAFEWEEYQLIWRDSLKQLCFYSESDLMVFILRFIFIVKILTEFFRAHLIWNLEKLDLFNKPYSVIWLTQYPVLFV